jgi:hypothetical protein
MPGIFEDEKREVGPIWSNPCGTWPIFPPDIVANCLKWPALQRNWRLAGEKMDHAGAITLNLNRP